MEPVNTPRGGPRSTLFRQEAIDARRLSLVGESLAAHPVSYPRLTAISVGIVLALVLFACFGELARKAEVRGYLAPSAGLIKVYAPLAGTLVERRVSEGQAVRRGDELFVVSPEGASTQLAETQATAIAQLEQRLKNLEAERADQQKLATVQASSLRESLISQERELRELDDSIALQRERAASAERIARRHAELLERHFVSQLDADQKYAESLEQQARLQELRRSRTQLERDIKAHRQELATTEISARQRLSEIERETLALAQERAEYQSRRSIVITAPADGTVTAIAGEIGQTVTDRTSLLAILPKDAELQAKLLVPSSSIGFIDIGDRVWLRYQAFPYQRFGSFNGEIVEIARTLMAPEELDLPVQATEPFYRVTVRLASQQVNTRAMDFPLQAGMQLDASLSLERRRLIEWAIEPLQSVTRRM
nr:HlyD family efflux transporter periplasmic adaptor subunit [uncultured Steroidobacter sp.]